MKNVGNSSDGRSQEVPKISGHPCIGRMWALRSHLCDSTAFLLSKRARTSTHFIFATNVRSNYYYDQKNLTKPTNYSLPKI